MNSISIHLRSLSLKIPHSNLSSAHVISAVYLGKRQHCCDQSGAIYITSEYVCTFWQGCYS